MHVDSKSMLGVVCLLVLLGPAAPSGAGPLQCERAILEESDAYAGTSLKALRRCQEEMIRGQLPVGTDCFADAPTATKLTRAASRFRRQVAASCGGGNHACDAADTGANADEPLAAIGWDIGTCPDFEGVGCINPIGDCNDITDCLSCITDVAVQQSIALYYGSLVLPSGNNDLTDCQFHLGRETTKFFLAKSIALEKCQGRVRRGIVSGPCPDARALADIAAAETSKVAHICRSCGGADRLCGGGDDFLPTDIGFVSECPAVVVPGGASCDAPISTLSDVVACVDCVTEFKDDCLDAVSVPKRASYPPECHPMPTATPTPEPTPTDTATPTTCLNGVLDPGEGCDPTAVTPGVCDAPAFCTSECFCVNQITCERTISKETARFAIKKMQVLRKCNEAIVAGKLSPPCPDATAATKIATAESTLRHRVQGNCGGVDGTCGTGDDFTLASIGWDIGACPNFENGACGNPITDCNGIADCLSCVAEAAVDQAMSLYYDAFVPSPHGSAENKCQLAIGKNTEKFYESKAKALQKCDDSILRGIATGPCPDAKAVLAITKAESKKKAFICKTCGGADKICGDGDDLTPAQIGFVASCPAVASCGGPITDLQSIVDCVDCVTEFKADCIDAVTVPQLTAYPTECNP